MSKTVDEGFRIFLTRLTPTAGETAAAQRHRASILARLKRDFQVNRFFRSGSFGNGTSIRGFSDVDYFAQIPFFKIRKTGRATLHAVWASLDDRFPNTQVAIRTPAVWLPFGADASESTDVVPAQYVGENGPNIIYRIPSYTGDWMITSPDAHNGYVSAVNNNLGSKVKQLIRLLKAWKYHKHVPLHSLYLELAVAKYAAGETYINYSNDIQRFLLRLWNNQLSKLQDPCGISGYVHPCVSETYKEKALSKLGRAAKRADNAWIAEQTGKTEEAFYWWNMFFDGYFPAF